MTLNIGYFADGPWSHKIFEKLIKDTQIKISFICVRFESKDETLKYYAKKFGIDYFEHKNVNSKEFISILKEYNCDLFVSMSFNQIFKNKIIDLANYKIINCHAGKLPFYRGRNVLNWALINDEKEFGITVHYVDDGIDTGDIILQLNYKISDKDNYKTLLDRSYLECANILYDVILMFKNGQVQAQKQTEFHTQGFYCTQRKIGDEILNWNQKSREIFSFVRAICSPGPNARTYLKSKEMKILKVELIEDAPIYKGIIGAIINKDVRCFYVKMQDSFIKIIDYEYDGKINIGDRFEI